MIKAQITLPSNRKFGFIFSVVFALFGIYIFLKNFLYVHYFFFLISFVFFILAIFKQDFLLPLNKIWMAFGLYIGKIVNPLVMGFIFFSIFTPIAIIMKLCGRDELRLKLNNYRSNWKFRNNNFKKETEFDKQF